MPLSHPWNLPQDCENLVLVLPIQYTLHGDSTWKVLVISPETCLAVTT